MTLDDLKKSEGLDLLIQYMDKKLGKDDLANCIEKYEDFDSFVRESNQTMTDFISKFDQKYNKIVKLNMTLPSAVLAFMLLKKANISKSEKMLVLTGMDYNKKEELYDQAKKSLLKFKGEQGGGGEASAVSSIKLEPVFLANQEEALWNAGYVRRNAGRRYRGYRGRPWQNFQRRRGNYQCGRNENYGNGNLKEPSTLRPVNPKGSDGRVMLCVACGSFRHLVADCPDSWENMKSVSVNTVEHGEGDSSLEVDESVMFTMVKQDSQNVEDVVLLAGLENGNIKKLCKEANRCAVLDSACSSTVCGIDWMEDYLCSLNEQSKLKVERNPGKKQFKFGGGEKLQSVGSFKIPAMIAGQEVMIITDIVDSDIPLLLSKTAMKKAGVKLNLQNDTAEIFGKNVYLSETTSGHYCLSINNSDEANINSVCLVNLIDVDEQSRYKILVKLH